MIQITEASIRICVIPSAHTPDVVAVGRFNVVHHAHDETNALPYVAEGSAPKGPGPLFY
jgi:hypothetical protein